MNRLHFASTLCLVLLSGSASLRAEASDDTPVPATSTAPTTVRTPILLTEEASRAMTGSLAAPNDVWITDPRPVFSWTAVKDATAYEVWVDSDRIAENVSGTFLSAPGDLALGQHSWQVRAVGPKSMAVTVSTRTTFTLAPRRNMPGNTPMGLSAAT